MNRTSTSSVTPHRAYGSIPQPNLLAVLPHLFLGKRAVEAGVSAWADRKQHISFFFSLLTLTKKKRSGRVGDIFILGGGAGRRSLLLNSLMIGRLILGIRKENRDRISMTSKTE